MTRNVLVLVGVALGLAIGSSTASAAIRQYWIAAVPVQWNVVPNGWDPISRARFTPAQTTFDTVVYQQFTPEWGDVIANRYGGIPGPLLRGRVGDTILVHFKNLDSNAPHSMHFHGVHYRPGSDGSYIPGISGPGANVKPGDSFTYRLVAGPDSIGVWPYHDHSPSMMDSIDGGMYGALSILGRNERVPDREFVVFFAPFHTFMAIDGRSYLGNTPLFSARVGEVVQWDVLALGDDFHTFHVHGHRWRNPDGSFSDTQTVGPAESFRIRWREDAPGTWYYHCHVESHMMAGMIGLYTVKQR